jgi:hypothetical protein
MNQPARTIPLLKSNEEQLAKVCRRLEDVFRNLNLIHDLMVVCASAVTSEGDCGSEAARCLELIGGNRLYGQLRVLTNIIERLGGTTEFTEREPALPATRTSAEQEGKSPSDVLPANNLGQSQESRAGP